MTHVDKKNVNPDEISLKALILKLGQWQKYLLSKWVIIVAVGIFGGALGVTYAILSKPVYNASLSFALEEDQSSGGGIGAAMGLASQFGIDLGGGNAGGAFSGDNLLELMKSRSMVESALLTAIEVNGKKQTLAELYIEFNNFREQWNKSPVLSHIQFVPNANRSAFTLQQDSILGVFYNGIIKKNLSVDKIDKKLSIIIVKVSSHNQLFSKYFAETLTKTVSDFYVVTKTKKSVQNVNILQRQTDSVRHELNQALSGVASSADVNPNPNPALQILRVPSMRRQVDVQANQAILTQLVANLEVAKVSLRKETPLIQIIDEPILPLEKISTGPVKSFIIGVFIASFLAIICLVIKETLTNLIN